MVTVLKRQKAHFRIDIRDLKSGKTRTLSLIDHDKNGVDEIAEQITECLNKKT